MSTVGVAQETDSDTVMLLLDVLENMNNHTHAMNIGALQVTNNIQTLIILAVIQQTPLIINYFVLSLFNIILS